MFRSDRRRRNAVNSFAQKMTKITRNLWAAFAIAVVFGLFKVASLQTQFKSLSARNGRTRERPAAKTPSALFQAQPSRVRDDQDVKSVAPYHLGLQPYKASRRRKNSTSSRNYAATKGGSRLLNQNATKAPRIRYVPTYLFSSNITDSRNNKTKMSLLLHNQTANATAKDSLESLLLLPNEAQVEDDIPGNNETTAAAQERKSSSALFSWQDPTEYFSKQSEYFSNQLAQLYKPMDESTWWASHNNANSNNKQQQRASSSKPPKPPASRPPLSRKQQEQQDDPALEALLRNRNPNDLLTVQDLQSILSVQMRQQQSSPFPDTQSTTKSSSPQDTQSSQRGMIEASSTEEQPPTSSTNTTKALRKARKKLAFPQPSVVSRTSIKWGSSIAASILGLFVGLSILPNLWLMGALVGGFYGYDVGRQGPQTDNQSAIGRMIVELGYRLAKAYLKVYDACNTLWFMYKTGQLSYDYYKKYAQLDERFAIQAKMDAWNARFAEGKIAFDRWEQQNEVGRKVLAGLRTMWLVEERSLQRQRSKQRRRQSKYRVVQIVYDTVFLMGRLLGKLWETATGGGSRLALREFLQGLVRWRDTNDVDETQSVGSRVGAALALCVLVNLSGALFSNSPALLSLCALAVGLAWPAWPGEAVDQLQGFWEDTRARGRGEDPATRTSSSSTSSLSPPQLPSMPSWTKAPIQKARKKAKALTVDKSRYHFYRDLNGKKRYYRVGRSWFGTRKQTEEKRWPWQSEKSSDSRW